MHFLSRCVSRNFSEALDLTRRAFKHRGLAVLGEIDVRKALQGYVSADFGPYVIFSVCCLELAKNALPADDEIGPMLVSNVVVQQRRGNVEMAVMDPVATIGSLNHVVMVQVANDLRCRLQAVFDEVDAECACDALGRSPTQAPTDRRPS